MQGTCAVPGDFPKLIMLMRGHRNDQASQLPSTLANRQVRAQCDGNECDDRDEGRRRAKYKMGMIIVGSRVCGVRSAECRVQIAEKREQQNGELGTSIGEELNLGCHTSRLLGYTCMEIARVKLIV